MGSRVRLYGTDEKLITELQDIEILEIQGVFKLARLQFEENQHTQVIRNVSSYRHEDDKWIIVDVECD